MTSPISPEPFGNFFAIWLVYFFFGLTLSFVVFVPGSIVLVLFTALRRTWSSLRTRLFRLGAFLFLAAPVGGFFSALWYCSIWGRIYVTFDVDDDDFNPVFPIDQTLINQEHGRMLIGTVHQLQLIWLAYAVITWGTTFLVYRLARWLMTIQSRIADERGALALSS